MIVTWILHHLRLSPGGRVCTSTAYHSYREETLFHGGTPLGDKHFSEMVRKVLDVKTLRTRLEGSKSKLTSCFNGVEYWSDSRAVHIENNIVLPSSHYLITQSHDRVTASIPTRHFVNGNEVYKIVVLHQNGTWTLSLGNTDVDVSDIGFALTHPASTLEQLLKVLGKLQLCTGIERPHIVSVSSNFVESWMVPGCENPSKRMRTQNCLSILSFLSTSTCCRMCQKLTVCKPKASVDLDVADEKDLRSVLDEILPNCPAQFKDLIEGQNRAYKSKGPTGVRWDKDMIQLCLSLYCRSPGTYKQLGQSSFLKLPSGRLLSMYKNAVPQESGIKDSVFQWMYEEAKRLRIPPTERQGGLILDEMALQPDLQMVRSGEGYKLVGFCELGDELDAVKNIKGGGSQKKELATHVLQLLFLGFGGFRFPIAHFPCIQATATDLHVIFWEAVEMLYSYGFPVLYTNMDGAITNRQFMRINFPSPPAEHAFMASNPVRPDVKVAFIMDYSHAVKKIRNSLYSSSEKGTRFMEASDGSQIIWQYWVEAYDYNSSNPVQIHHKLTYQHMQLDNSDKMRNQLAEDVLDKHMLQLMYAYQSSLGQAGVKLNAVISLLLQTSDLIEIFRDPRPLTDLKDTRLDKLKRINKWFKEWERDITKKYATPSRRNKCLMTAEAREDLDSCISGFIGMVQMRQKLIPGATVIPARLNSDVIENIFCQQRGLHNGANTNPAYSTYAKTVNSVVLCHSSLSNRSNTGGKDGAQPYTFSTPNPLNTSQKRKASTSCTSSPSGTTVPQKQKIIRL